MIIMLNKCVLIGRLVRDPELRYTSNGNAVTNFTLAVERPFTNQEGEQEVDFIDIVTWKKLAESSAQHLQKGRLIAVTGRLQIRKNTSDNRTYINPEIVARTVKFLDSANSNVNGNNRNNPDRKR